MAKLSISRLFETAEVLVTQAGQQLQTFIDYTTELSKQLVSAMANGLNFSDNFDCIVSTVSLTHNVGQIVSTTKTPIGVFPIRAYSVSDLITGFNWYLDNNNALNVRATFQLATSSPIQVTLVILYS